MTRLTAATLAQDTAGLLRRFGAALYLDFLALGVAATTLQSLLAPESLRRLTRGDVDASVFALITDPAILGEEALFTILFAAGCLRIWRASGGETSDPAAALRQMLAPLIVLSLATGFLAYFGMFLLILPGIVVLALTTTLVPMIVIEGRGWFALRATLSQCRPALGVLSLAWALTVIPLVIVATAVGPPPLAADAPITALWLGWLAPDLIAAMVSTLTLAMSMAAYLRLQPAGGADLEDVFR
ncbi:hypothetical protein [Oceanibium sediminis]|uniref:hypothetical protein n=1 Tax=Oceanibium sediminis TaxID=2026339 RepID=UPI000DD4DEBF|nr:hypothetical protein [Oceanibium sediminis]